MRHPVFGCRCKHSLRRKEMDRKSSDFQLYNWNQRGMRARVYFDVVYYLFPNVFRAWAQFFITSSKYSRNVYWRYNFLVTPGINACCNTRKKCLIHDHFHHVGKHVECKFTIYTIHRAHCLADNTLFTWNRRIFTDKKERTSEARARHVCFQNSLLTEFMFYESIFQLDGGSELFNGRCYFSLFFFFSFVCDINYK